MAKVLLFLISLSCGGPLSAAPIPPAYKDFLSKDPKAVEAQVELMQGYNINLQTRQPLDAKLRGWVDIKLYLVPTKDIELYAAKNTDSRVFQKFFTVYINKQKYIRFPVHPNNLKLQKQLSSKYNEDKTTLKGAYLISGRTFLCLSDEIDRPFYLKLDGYQPQAAFVRHLNEYDVYSSTLTTDILSEEPFDFFTEPFGAALSASKSAFLVRDSLTRNNGSRFNGLLPAHTFLNPEFLTELSNRTGTSGEEILKSLRMTLAQYLVQTSLVSGVGLALHTQNANILFDLRTGLVREVKAQDLGDILFDDEIRSLNNKRKIKSVRTQFEHALAVVGREKLENADNLQGMHYYMQPFLIKFSEFDYDGIEKFYNELVQELKNKYIISNSPGLEKLIPDREMIDIKNYLIKTHAQLRQSGTLNSNSCSAKLRPAR